MTLEDDVALMLGAWEQQLRTIDENLIALEGEPTYQMLSGGARARLEGVTRERVVPALEAMTELFEHRERLQEVFARARALEQDAGFWDKDDKLRQIMSLLQGPSIKLGARPTPLAQRSLLAPAATEQAVVPQELLGAMAHAFEVARDVVAAVSEAWTRLEPRLAEAEQRVERLRTDATALGGGAVQGDLAWLAGQLAHVRTVVANDPLGVSGSFDEQLFPRILEGEAALRELATQKSRVTDGLRDSLSLLGRVIVTRKEAASVAERLPSELADVTLPALSDQGEALGLGAWRERIAEVAHAGRFRAADVGLARWFDVARALLATDRSVLKAFDDALDRRAELHGRLSARHAQLRALAARGVAGTGDLDALATCASRLLKARPTELEAAARAVDDFDARVVRLGRS